ncbi:MAG: aspartate/glutamate racemase family protein [Rhizobiaceae bacterium]|nr:aspartate/glutamate racemase family protein [Rhizobiaceae bacterium]
MSGAENKAVFRFWHQSATELDALGGYKAFISTHGAKVLEGRASIELHGVRSGSYFGRAVTPALRSAFAFHRILDQIIDRAIEAERQGFDAFIIASFSEPFLREIRSVVRIPVISMLESALLVGCSLGRKVVPIANGSEIAAVVRDAVDMHGLDKRVMPAVSLSPAWHEPALAASLSNPSPVIDAFKKAAQEAISQGAEVIVPAEGVMATVLSSQGITQIDDAPVLDVFAIAWLYALMLVSLRRTIGTQTSNVGYYAQGDRGLLNLLIEQG